MVALTPPVCDFGWPAPDFDLPGTDGQRHRFADVAGSRGTLIVFMCNHCPYVLAILDKLMRDAAELQALGIGVAGICSNDAAQYPADSFENMVKLADARGFPFPYLHDEDQQVARAYGAVCTPDFFGFDNARGLQYRGRLDGSTMRSGGDDQRRELFEAMQQVARTGAGPQDQVPSIGCSIKWRAI